MLKALNKKMKKWENKSLWKKITLVIAAVVVIIGCIGLYWYNTLEDIDLSSIVTVQEYGIDGGGKLHVETMKEPNIDKRLQRKLQKASHITHIVSQGEDLSNGDVVTIYANVPKMNYLMHGLRPINTQKEYTVNNLLVADMTWEELPGKDRIYNEMMELAARHEQDYLAYLKKDAHENLGGNPEVWLDYEFEQAYYGPAEEYTRCYNPDFTEETINQDPDFDNCGQMFLVFKVQKHIQEPYFYQDNSPDYVGFRLESLYMRNGELVMGEFDYDDTYPEFYATVDYEHGLKNQGVLEKVEF